MSDVIAANGKLPLGDALRVALSSMIRNLWWILILVAFHFGLSYFDEEIRSYVEKGSVSTKVIIWILGYVISSYTLSLFVILIYFDVQKFRMDVGFASRVALERVIPLFFLVLVGTVFLAIAGLIFSLLVGSVISFAFGTSDLMVLRFPISVIVVSSVVFGYAAFAILSCLLDGTGPIRSISCASVLLKGNRIRILATVAVFIALSTLGLFSSSLASLIRSSDVVNISLSVLESAVTLYMLCFLITAFTALRNFQSEPAAD